MRWSPLAVTLLFFALTTSITGHPVLGIAKHEHKKRAPRAFASALGIPEPPLGSDQAVLPLAPSDQCPHLGCGAHPRPGGFGSKFRRTLEEDNAVPPPPSSIGQSPPSDSPGRPLGLLRLSSAQRYDPYHDSYAVHRKANNSRLGQHVQGVPRFGNPPNPIPGALPSPQVDRAVPPRSPGPGSIGLPPTSPNKPIDTNSSGPSSSFSPRRSDKSHSYAHSRKAKTRTGLYDKSFHEFLQEIGNPAQKKNSIPGALSSPPAPPAPRLGTKELPPDLLADYFEHLSMEPEAHREVDHQPRRRSTYS